MPTTLLSTDTLAAHLDDPAWAVIDTRFDLARPDWGEAEYRAAHIPGAVYAHLDRHLSGPKTGRNGRHPLPEAAAFKAQLGRWGVQAGVQVVVYDQADGMYAARLWWMLRALGHATVAVLDGGWAKWLREGRPVRSGDEYRLSAVFSGPDQLGGTVTPEQAAGLAQGPAARLLDARAPQRYRGEVEPLDPVAGHIPGALNYPYPRSVQPDGTFRPAAEVRAELEAVLGQTPPSRAATYCGSGVTACHVILAAEHAGLPGLQLYPGSWSEWCADPARPIATGPG
jgi:thiosulfate/3-mercaptopyruvate sulfurtransferase